MSPAKPITEMSAAERAERLAELKARRRARLRKAAIGTGVGVAALCQGRTVLMIAHRLHTIMHADHIVVLDHGRIAGQGTHAALLRECPLYHQLWLDHEAARDWTLATALPQAEGGLQS